MIFISYRRDDSRGWSGRLFSDLRQRFGKAQVFMDVEDGGIPRGADFAKTLDAALERCDVLIALVGPQWGTLERAGKRRIDCDDDWVRREIGRALQREILVVPTLVGGGVLPDETQLPPDLRGLWRRQLCTVLDDRWDADIARLTGDLAGALNIGAARAGLDGLREVMARRPALARAVYGSREVIESTYHRLDELDAYKVMHDALHVIEFECLRPLQESPPDTRLGPFGFKFKRAAKSIRERLEQLPADLPLRLDVEEQLGPAELALQTAVDAPAAAAVNDAVGAMNTLVSGLAPRLDAAIGEAAQRLDLDRLVALMREVDAQIPRTTDGDDAELAPLRAGIAAIESLRDALTSQVGEHARFQRLDTKLRSVCLGATVADAVPGEWVRIKQLRARIAPPWSPLVHDALPNLEACEADIEASLTGASTAPPLELLAEYFLLVSQVFREIDSSLKEFSARLNLVGRPLRTVLEML